MGKLENLSDFLVGAVGGHQGAWEDCASPFRESVLALTPTPGLCRPRVTEARLVVEQENAQKPPGHSAPRCLLWTRARSSGAALSLFSSLPDDCLGVREGRGISHIGANQRCSVCQARDLLLGIACWSNSLPLQTRAQQHICNI